MSGPHKLRILLWRWHKRIGLACALVVVLVTISGILLNHTKGLQLGQSAVQQNWLLSYYGIQRNEAISFPTSHGWVSGDDQGNLYLGLASIGRCQSHLKGALVQDQLLWIGCSEELLVATTDGEIQERIGSVFGLPVPIAALGSCGRYVCFNASGGTYRLDFQSLNVSAVPGSEVVWLEPPRLSKDIDELTPLLDGMAGASLSWERVVLDLHSGRIAGIVGVLIVDVAAVGMLFLALSGFWIWYKRSAARRPKK